jgi:hypothetical protein
MQLAAMRDSRRNGPARASQDSSNSNPKRPWLKVGSGHGVPLRNESRPRNLSRDAATSPQAKCANRLRVVAQWEVEGAESQVCTAKVDESD